jgi:hypothetical protein
MSKTKQLSKFISDAVNATTAKSIFADGVGNVSVTNDRHTNLVINGGFDIWQRGTSFSWVTGTYCADHWLMGFTQPTGAVSRQTFTPGQTEVPGNPIYYLNWTQASDPGTATLASPIENVTLSSGKTFTISCWIRNRSTITGTFNLGGMTSYGTGGTPTTGLLGIGLTGFFTANDSVWRKISTTVTFPTVAGVTLGTNGNDYFAPYIRLPVSRAINIDFAQFQMEEGILATDFEQRPYQTELAMCQRYYEKSFPQGTNPAQNTGSTAGAHICPQVVGASATQNCGTIRFAVTKRAAPTVTLYNPSAANAQFRNASTNADCSATTSVSAATDTVINPVTTTPAGSAAGQSLTVHWTAEAEL